jgi:hypothetical protein
MEANMNKILAAAMFAAAVMAMPFGAAMAAQQSQGVYVGSKYYPPCTSETQDNCVQVPQLRRHDAMKSEMSSRKEGKMSKSTSTESVAEIAPAAGGSVKITPSNTPRGCSPLTTPCSKTFTYP